MLIIRVEIMKTIDEREMQKTTKEKQAKTESMVAHSCQIQTESST